MQQALSWGLISDVYKKENYHQEVLKIAQKLTNLSQTALIVAKKVK